MPVGEKSQRKHGRKKLSERGDTYYLTKSMAVRGFEKLCDEFDKKNCHRLQRVPWKFIAQSAALIRKKNTDLVFLILTYLDGKFIVILRRRTTKKTPLHQ